jgi:hypothetical protein
MSRTSDASSPTLATAATSSTGAAQGRSVDVGDSAWSASSRASHHPPAASMTARTTAAALAERTPSSHSGTNTTIATAEVRST